MRAACACFVISAACSFDASGVGDGAGTSSVGDATSGSTVAATTSTSGAADTTSGTGVNPADTSTSASDETSSTGLPATGDETTGGDPCAVCDPDATCVVAESGPECTCPEPFVGDGANCAVAPALEGLRVELPCALDLGSTCGVALEAKADRAMIGEPGVTYDVELRIRGIVERKNYVGGTEDGLWLEGGDFGLDGDNAVTLTISEPAQTFRLNSDAAGEGTGVPVVIDYDHAVQIAAGANVRLALTSVDLFEAENPGLVIPEVAPDPFDGQLVQIDIVMITTP